MLKVLFALSLLLAGALAAQAAPPQYTLVLRGAPSGNGPDFKVWPGSKVMCYGEYVPLDGRSPVPKSSRGDGDFMTVRQSTSAEGRPFFVLNMDESEGASSSLSVISYQISKQAASRICGGAPFDLEGGALTFTAAMPTFTFQ